MTIRLIFFCCLIALLQGVLQAQATDIVADISDALDRAEALVGKYPPEKNATTDRERGLAEDWKNITNLINGMPDDLTKETIEHVQELNNALSKMEEVQETYAKYDEIVSVFENKYRKWKIEGKPQSTLTKMENIISKLQKCADSDTKAHKKCGTETLDEVDAFTKEHAETKN